MIFLRFVSFLIGIGIPMALPILLSDAGTRGMPGRPVIVGLLGIGLVSGSFLYIALLAPRMRRSLVLRILGGLLLMLPAAASLAVLWTRTQEAMLWGGGMLLLASVLMFISFIFPATPDRRQRPMRARDRQEPALS